MLKKMVCLLLGVAAASALPIDAAVEGDTNPTVRGTTFASVPRPDDIDFDLDTKSTCTDGAAACRKCQPWQKRVRWTWRYMYNDYVDHTQEAFKCLKRGPLEETENHPANGCDEPDSAAKIRNVTKEKDLMLGRSKRVLFSALKMARRSGDLTKFMWMHGVPMAAITNHFTSHFLPWHRKNQLEYENLLRAQGFDDDVEEDEECPGCRDWYSCLTTPAWDWTADQSDCEHATSGSIYYKSDVRTGDPKKVPHPWRRDNTTDKFDGTRSMGKGCTSYSAASQAR